MPKHVAKHPLCTWFVRFKRLTLYRNLEKEGSDIFQCRNSFCFYSKEYNKIIKEETLWRICLKKVTNNCSKN